MGDAFKLVRTIFCLFESTYTTPAHLNTIKTLKINLCSFSRCAFTAVNTEPTWFICCLWAKHLFSYLPVARRLRDHWFYGLWAIHVLTVANRMTSAQLLLLWPLNSMCLSLPIAWLHVSSLCPQDHAWRCLALLLCTCVCMAVTSLVFGRTYICTYVRTYTRTGECVCSRMCMHVYAHVHVSTHISAKARTWMECACIVCMRIGTYVLKQKPACERAYVRARA